jgi:hypothetical protein
LVPATFSISCPRTSQSASPRSDLTTANASTILVALAAGVAGVLSLATLARSVVGVAISITTIPAAAYLGSAAGARETVRASGALAVLGVNIAVLVLPGTLPLAWVKLSARTRKLTTRNRSGDARREPDH